jgi:acetaldehyde dehydrogenase
LGVPLISDGIDGLVQMPGFDEFAMVFVATSAASHARHDSILRSHGKQIVDLTPAAIGPYVVPAVNLDQLTESPNLNMVTCGGQATIPSVAAVSQVTPVVYAEIVASIASRSAGPGTRANIDEFTQTTARGLEQVGGAHRGKAIIILNPAEPPLVMRNTVFCFVEDGDPRAIESSVERMVKDVQAYVPGFRLKQAVQFEEVTKAHPVRVEGIGLFGRGLKVSVFLEVEGAGHYLPTYAGNLDIMTSAALRTGERLATAGSVVTGGAIA